jgi:hypothetical protein
MNANISCGSRFFSPSQVESKIAELLYVSPKSRVSAKVTASIVVDFSVAPVEAGKPFKADVNKMQADFADAFSVNSTATEFQIGALRAMSLVDPPAVSGAKPFPAAVVLGAALGSVALLSLGVAAARKRRSSEDELDPYRYKTGESVFNFEQQRSLRRGSGGDRNAMLPRWRTRSIHSFAGSPPLKMKRSSESRMYAVDEY